MKLGESRRGSLIAVGEHRDRSEQVVILYHDLVTVKPNRTGLFQLSESGANGLRRGGKVGGNGDARNPGAAQRWLFHLP